MQDAPAGGEARCPKGHPLQRAAVTRRDPCARCAKHTQKEASVLDCRLCNWYLCETCSTPEQGPAAPAAESAQQGAAQATPTPATEEAEDAIWSVIVEIDMGLPFELFWPDIKGGVMRALRVLGPGSEHSRLQEMGWRGERDYEEAARRAFDAAGAAQIVRGRKRSEADRIVASLRGLRALAVRDPEAAAAARAARNALQRPGSEGEENTTLLGRRESLRRRLRGLRELTRELQRGGLSADDLPHMALSQSSLLLRVEQDLEDDERWEGKEVMMEQFISTLEEAHFDLFLDGRMARDRRVTTLLLVCRSSLLSSALNTVVCAAAQDLLPGQLQVKYRGEEGEDGEGGGGVTRTFLTEAGKLLGQASLGLLLPAAGGHLQLSPLLGFLGAEDGDAESVRRRPMRWARFLGRMLGMSVAHECPLGLLLAPSLCKQLLGKEPDFNDLQFVPGLNDGAAGWYGSLRALLAHRAPDLVKDCDTLPRLDDQAVEEALSGLEAEMPSRSKQVFEAMSSSVAASARTPALWEGAVAVARSLLRAADRPPQLRQAARQVRPLLEAVLADSDVKNDARLAREGSKDLKNNQRVAMERVKAPSAALHRGLVALRATWDQVSQSSAAFPDGLELGRLLRAAAEIVPAKEEAVAIPLQAPEGAGERDEDEEEDDEEGGESQADTGGEDSDKEPSSPPSLCRDASKVVLAEDKPCVLSVDSLAEFARALARKAMHTNLQPHLDAVAEEFRSVVPSRTLQGLEWQQLQDRLCGKRLDTRAFVAEWRRRTTYHGCEEADRRVRQWWDHVATRSNEELRRLFAWCTGYAAVPVTAWKFQIQAVDDARRCPTVNTCLTDDPSAANRGVKRPTLYLPDYASQVELARRLEWSVAGACAMLLH